MFIKSYIKKLHAYNKECWKLKASLISEAATGGVLYEKVFLKILQISQENTSVGVSF